MINLIELNKKPSIIRSSSNKPTPLESWQTPMLMTLEINQTHGNPSGLFEDHSGIAS